MVQKTASFGLLLLRGHKTKVFHLPCAKVVILTDVLIQCHFFYSYSNLDGIHVGRTPEEGQCVSRGSMALLCSPSACSNHQLEVYHGAHIYLYEVFPDNALHVSSNINWPSSGTRHCTYDPVGFVCVMGVLMCQRRGVPPGLSPDLVMTCRPLETSQYLMRRTLEMNQTYVWRKCLSMSCPLGRVNQDDVTLLAQSLMA